MKDKNGMEHDKLGLFTSSGSTAAEQKRADKLIQSHNEDVVEIKRQAQETNQQIMDEKLKKFVEDIDNISDKEQYIIGDVFDRERNDIESLTGEKLNATEHVIGASEIRHIVNRHGAKGEADQSMASAEDIAKIGYVIRNYDYIELLPGRARLLNGNREPAQIVLYHKSFNDGTRMVAEAITDGKKGRLRILTTYKIKRTPV